MLKLIVILINHMVHPEWISKYLNVALKEYHQKYFESAKPMMDTYDKERYFKIQKYFPSDGYFVYHCESS